MSCQHIITQAAARIASGKSSCKRTDMSSSEWYAYTCIKNALYGAALCWHGPVFANCGKDGTKFVEPAIKLLEKAFGMNLEMAGRLDNKLIIDTLTAVAGGRDVQAATESSVPTPFSQKFKHNTYALHAAKVLGKARGLTQ